MTHGLDIRSRQRGDATTSQSLEELVRGPAGALTGKTREVLASSLGLEANTALLFST